VQIPLEFLYKVIWWGHKTLLKRPCIVRDRDGLIYTPASFNTYCQLMLNKGNPERREELFVKKNLKPSMTVFDVGANIGLYTCLMARLVSPGGEGSVPGSVSGLEAW